MAGAELSTTPLHLLSSRRKTQVAVCLCVNTILLNACLGVVGPVFPLEVRKVFPINDAKHGFAIGFVFSIATITDFLSAPLIGLEMPRLGAKRTFGLGAFLVGCLMFLFSFVSEIYDWPTFLGFCYAIRFCQGFGTAMVFVSTFSLLVGTFPDNVAMMTGLVEVFTGLGFMVGPAIGGVLYQYGGFKAPFMTLGGALLIGMIVNQFLLPNTPVTQEKEASFPATKIIRQPRNVLMLITFCSGMAGLTFFDPSLGLFLHVDFNLSPATIGAVFLIGPGAYMLLAPIAGGMADKYSGKVFIPLGLLISAIGFEMMGPRTLFGLREHLGLALSGYLVIGTGCAFLVPISADILNTMKKAGYPDSPQLHSTVGGLVGASYSSGATIGPLIGGSLTAHFQLGRATAIFGIFFFVLCIVVVLQTIGEWYFAKRAGKSLPDPASDMTPLTDTVASN